MKYNNYKNRNILRGFRRLDVWKLGIQIYKDVHLLLKEKNYIPFKVKAQVEDAALSISRNIAEGYARRTLKENIRFYEIAASSAVEVYSQLHALYHTKQLTDDEFNLLDSKLYEFENKMISMNRRMIEKLRNGDKWKDGYE